MSSVVLYCTKKNLEDLINLFLNELFIKVLAIDLMKNFPYSLITSYLESKGNIKIQKKGNKLYVEIDGTLDSDRTLGLKVKYEAEDNILSFRDSLTASLVAVGRELTYKADNVYFSIRALLSFNEDVETACWYRYVMKSTGSEK